MKNLIVVNKKEGETPLSALESFRAKHKQYVGIKMTYAGRLDPMASGLLLILAGEETKNKDKYLALDKEYEFKILFGFATDTYDILGKVVSAEELHGDKKTFEKNIKQNMKKFTGEFIQKYPLYSSKTVNGKQLFAYARAGEDIEAPERKVIVKKLIFLKLETISQKKLLSDIERRVKRVEGDFRQAEILKIWKKVLKTKNSRKFFLASFKIKCGSGTYVRGIANGLGEIMRTPALAFSIKRTKVGKWSLLK